MIRTAAATALLGLALLGHGGKGHAGKEHEAAPAGSLIAVNQGDKDLSIIDLATGKLAGEIAEEGRGRTEDKVHEVAISPDGKTMLAPIYGSAGVGSQGTNGSEILVIDVATRKLIKVVDLGHGVRPHKPVYDPHHNVWYVTTELDKSITALDPRTFEVLYQVPTGAEQSHMLVISHDGHWGYTANVSTGTVSVLDLEARKTAAIVPVAGHIQRIAISNDDRTVYVSDQNRDAPRLAAIDTATRQVRGWVALPATGYGGVITADGKRMLLALPKSKQVAVIDLKKLKLERTIDVPGNPQEMLLSPDGSVAWVSCNLSKQVAEIDTHSLAVRRLLPAGNWVDGLAWTPLS